MKRQLGSSAKGIIAVSTVIIAIGIIAAAFLSTVPEEVYACGDKGSTEDCSESTCFGECISEGNSSCYCADLCGCYLSGSQ